jgi:hypothetical protein
MPPFRPFNHGEFVQNADGSQSTERTITWQMPDGRWVNTPTLFMTPNGVLDLSTPDKEEQARQAAMVLMKNGTEFPTFKSPDEAESFATGRSKGGGVFQGQLGHQRPGGLFGLPPLPPPMQPTNAVAAALRATGGGNTLAPMPRPPIFPPPRGK